MSQPQTRPATPPDPIPRPSERGKSTWRLVSNPQIGVVTLWVVATLNHPHTVSAVTSEAPSGWSVAKVVTVSERRSVVTVSVGVGVGVGVEPGDRLVVLHDGRPMAAGEVIVVAANEAGVTLGWTARTPQVGDPVIVLGRRVLRTRSQQLPRGTTVHATLSALNPDAAMAWITVGRSVGVQTGDRFLVWRAGVPIARGETTLTDDRTSWLALTPLVRDLRPSRGDRVSLSPSPFERQAGRHVAIVLSAKVRDDGQVLVLGTVEPNRFRPDDRLDIFRAGAYVGYATVTRSDGVWVEAATVPALGPRSASVGDRAVQRNTRTSRAWISRIEGAVCLITVGQRDGVRFGQSGYLTGNPSVQLSVENVLDEHSVARVTPTLSREGKSASLWDEVRLESHEPRLVVPLTLGRMPKSMPVSWLASVPRVPDGPRVEPGWIVRCESHPPAAALVLHVDPNQVVLYCPESWRFGSVADCPVVLPPTSEP